MGKTSELSLIEIIRAKGGITDLGLPVFHLCDFRRLTGTGVYLAVIGNEKHFCPLYVGSSRNILSRISDPAHESLRKAMGMGAKIFIIPCSGEKKARDIELAIIRHFKPMLNIAGKPAEEQPAVA